MNVKADPNDIKPLDLQKVVTKTLGTSEESVVQMMMLRSLKQAHYSEDPLGTSGSRPSTTPTLLPQSVGIQTPWSTG